jgi:hypothetical protein
MLPKDWYSLDDSLSVPRLCVSACIPLRAVSIKLPRYLDLGMGMRCVLLACGISCGFAAEA